MFVKLHCSYITISCHYAADNLPSSPPNIHSGHNDGD